MLASLIQKRGGNRCAALWRWPAAWLVAALLSGCASTAIKVDGNSQEWDAIAPLVLDPAGDYAPASEDLRVLRITHSNQYLYILMEYEGDPKEPAPNSGQYLYVDADRQRDTGMRYQGIGADFGLSLAYPHYYMGRMQVTAEGIGGFQNDMPGAVTAAWSDCCIEIRILRQALAMPSGDQDAVIVVTDNDRSAAKQYILSLPRE